jgi:hypothetical protein
VIDDRAETITATARAGAAIVVGERHAPLRPADLRVELIENTPQTV